MGILGASVVGLVMHLDWTSEWCKWALHVIVLAMDDGIGTHFGCHVGHLLEIQLKLCMG